ncbi:unnamed protein product [Spodoptera littoralis]|uniref:Protein LTV1 homolog n=1 Tax=Spodoptera littoralis TaxID=7109 RepID=A0A9P0I6F7_SPOLI|nr:unnamed protein product [Spodoptera littoralis]CAH1640807.1 unnamed protein product [Spodoptera littoralis]
MPKTKKKFIDRKKAVTFNLVHRSQRDPLAADETAPQRVLVPVSANIPQKKEKDPELTPEQRREEQIKYGIYFDDDYNYLQHLKDSREVTLVVQPASVSTWIQKWWQLWTMTSISRTQTTNWKTTLLIWLWLKDGRPARGGRMRNWEARDNDDTKSRFSQYSMSSSVMRRNQGLTLLDNRFEKMFAEYDDTEVGALDLEEIEGFMPETHDMLLQAAEHFEESQRKYQLDKEKEIARINRLQEIEEESEEELVTVEKPKKIKLNARGIPKDVLGKDNKLTVKSLAKFNAMQKETGSSDEEDDGKTNAETILSTLSVLSIRPKDETPEDKKERKRLLKEYRKERRVEKKANKEAFKEEKKRQEKIMMNNKNNVQGNRIL